VLQLLKVVNKFPAKALAATAEGSAVAYFSLNIGGRS
jgi:hypothetical protein